MTTTVEPVGLMLRQWRERRRLSQLDLALQTEISARHLSFIETGRSKPSSDMILRITEELEVPLRDRNRALLAGGYAPAFRERPLDSPQMGVVRDAIRKVLTAHEPYPAVLVDRHWQLLDANSGVALLLEGVAPELIARGNVLEVSLHPEGMAPRIANLGQWRAHLLQRLRRQAAVTADPELVALLRRLRALPCDEPEPDLALPAAGNIVVPLEFRVGERVLSFLSFTAIFGTPLDVTLEELAIESFYPADAETADFLRSRG